MKFNWKLFRNIFIGTIIVDFIGWFLLVSATMTDEPVPPIAQDYYFFVHYVLGFPLVFINEKLPFFLEAKEFTILLPISITINNSIISLMIYSIIKFFRRNK